MSRYLNERGLIAYIADELSPDVLHNRLIAATIGRLGKADVDPQLAWELRRLAMRWPTVGTIDPTPSLFRRVHIHRHNASYRFLLHLCELILRHLLPEDGDGEFRFHDFRASAQEMGLLFQDFVRNYLAREQRFYGVRAENVQWDATATVPAQMRWLPKMRTDVSLVAPGRKVVVEVKYPANLFQTAWAGSAKLHSDDLYQLFSYLKNLECRGGADATVLVKKVVSGGVDNRDRLNAGVCGGE